MRLHGQGPLAACVCLAACPIAWTLSGGGETFGAAPPLVWSIATTDSYPPHLSWAPNGGVYVTSTSSVGSLTRYDANGVQLWRRLTGSSTRASNVATDSAGNAYVAGEAYGSLDGPNLGNGDVFLRKYSPDGDLHWGAQFGTSLFDWPTGLAVDETGSAYVANGPWATNYSVPPPGTLSQLRKYDASGAAGWARELDTQDGTYPGNGGSMSSGTSVSADGFVYSTFSNYALPQPNTIDSSTYLAKASLAGQVQWIAPLPNISNVFATAVDSQNNVYVASSNGLTKLNGAGDVLWQTSNDWRLDTITIGSGDRIFVVGDLHQAGFLGEYDLNGALRWSTVLPKASNEQVTFYGLTTSGNRLIGAALVARDGYWTENLIRAYQIPELPVVVLGAPAVIALGVLGRRHGRPRDCR